MPIDSTGVEFYPIKGFKFVGGTSKDIKVAYRSFNPKGSKGTVFIPTCFGGRINKTLNFTSGALKDYHVVVAAMLGNGESSSPSNDDQYPSDYSQRYQDCINAHYQLLTEHLGIKSLEAVIGFSMGGQQAYHWAAMHGTGSSPFVRRAVVICGSAKTSGHNYTFLEGPINALLSSRDYDEGRYKSKGVRPAVGLRAFANAYAAWLTSAAWFRQDLWKDLGAKSLQDWIHPPAGSGSYDDWDPEDLITLARMWQAGDIGIFADDGSYETALKSITAKVLVMPCETDQYFVRDDGEHESKVLQNGTFEPIPSVWGHLAGGGANPQDVDWMDEKIAEFIA